VANLEESPTSSFQIQIPASVAAAAALAVTAQPRVLLGTPVSFSAGTPASQGLQLQLANQRSAVIEWA